MVRGVNRMRIHGGAVRGFAGLPHWISTRRDGKLRPRAHRAKAQWMTELVSTLTCPDCGQQTTEQMPTDFCQYFYDCPGCGAVLRPLSGHCCVYCSYGAVPCPPVQEARAKG